MIEIRNKLNQRLNINLLSGPIDLLAKSTAMIPDDDFSSSHLQNLLGSGKVILVSRMEDTAKSKLTQKKGELPKKKIPEPAESEIPENLEEKEPEIQEIEVNPEESQEQTEEKQEKERSKSVHKRKK